MRYTTSARVALWTLIWMALIDLAVNVAFRPSPNALQATNLQRYFEYGRSVEGKLAQAVAGDPADAPILSAGWINDAVLQQASIEGLAGSNLSVTLYGQSFTFNATKEAARLDGHIALRGIGGPGAPPNHSYAAYKADEPHRKTDVTVFGILSSTVGQMGSMSGLIWMFESPAPFTFPRYRLNGEQLVEERPVITSEAQFRQAFSSRDPLWHRFKEQLRHNDRGYDEFTFSESMADRSSMVRLIRRGWVAHHQSYDKGVYEPGVGFDAHSEEIRVLKAMLLDIAQRSRARKERLVVLLLHTKGQGNHLHAALKDTLQGAGIDYVSTDSVFSANDPSNFLADGHYTASANTLLAKALLAKLKP
ncbi:hypothetical protein ACVNIS_05350 [Sphaerotilaceae bacterium SBD11-9]